MAKRASYPIFKAFTETGALAAGYKLYTYKAGTALELSAWQDAAATTPHTNPIILDSLGEAEIFLSEATKFTLTDPDGNIVTGWPVDNISPASVLASEVDFIPSGSLASTNVQDAIAELEVIASTPGDLPESLPVGATIIWFDATPPTGYLEADGSAISRATYSALFAKHGVKFGAGNGSTTFNIPDLRGRFPRGWAHGQTTDPDRATRTDRGDGTGGDVVGSKQASANASHTHSTQNTCHVGACGSNAVSTGSDGVNASTWNTGASGGSESRPININVMFCIKF